MRAFLAPPDLTSKWLRIAPLLLALGPLAQHALGSGQQGPGQPVGKPVRVTGTVANSLTGAGVSKALVQAFGPSQASVLTGADGRFEMPDLPEGQYSFQVQKPGFFNQQDVNLGRSGPSSALVRDGMPEVQLTLVPEASIDGHVADEDGEPIEDVNIQVFSNMIMAGRRQWMNMQSAKTDASGSYHAGGLRPGTYAIRAEGDAANVAERPTGQSFTLVLALTYYPGAATIDQAAPIKLAAGQQAQIDFSMKAQAGYRVSGVVTNPPSTPFSLSLRRQDDDEPFPNSYSQVRNGAFRTRSVAPGAYVLDSLYQSAEGELFAEVPVIVSDADVTGVSVTLERPFEIPVQVSVTRNRSSAAAQHSVTYGNGASNVRRAANSSLGYISLRALGRATPRMMDAPPSANLHEGSQADAPIQFQRVVPGRYELISTVFSPYYIESARCGDAELLDEPLVVSSGSAPPPIQISLRDDTATLSIISVEDGKPVPSYLLLVPARGAASEFGLTSNAAPPVAPGSYKVYAFDTLADLEYANPEAMRQYAGSAQEVTVEANGSATVTVEVTHRSPQ